MRAKYTNLYKLSEQCLSHLRPAFIVSSCTGSFQESVLKLHVLLLYSNGDHSGLSVPGLYFLKALEMIGTM